VRLCQRSGCAAWRCFSRSGPALELHLSQDGAVVHLTEPS
jgi:hypothetical protein